MADFEIVDEPTQSQFEVVDEPQFEVEPSKSDWAAGVAASQPSLPAEAGIRMPKSDKPKAEKKSKKADAEVAPADEAEDAEDAEDAAE